MKRKGQIPIRCRHEATQPAHKFLPHPKNWNTHPPEQLRLYAKLIRAHGWRRPVVISARSGYIIRGHGAVQAALAHDLGPVPYETQPYASETEELADLTADNKLAEHARADEAKLDALLADLDTAGLDRELAGLIEELENAFVGLLPHETKPPPKMAWALIGLPVGSFGQIAADIERIARIPEAIVETTLADETDR
jgi:ParB-like chromosome segregation protein Spo0J